MASKSLYKNKPEKSEPQKKRDAWLSVLEKEAKVNDKKRERAQEVVDVYADDRKDNDTANQFNILWSNTQVLAGALYSHTPKPDIRRRFLDRDPVSREVAAVLERSASFLIDSYDFDGTAGWALNDYLVPGFGQVRIRYKPFYEKGPSIPVTAEEDGTFRYLGEEIEPELTDAGTQYSPDVIAYQEVTCEPVEWRKFRWDHLAKRWEDVNWCCIDHYMTRSELVEEFGAIGKKISLTHSDSGKAKSESEQSHALVHEIFDKKKRQIIYVSEGYKEGPIQSIDDELKLEGFFPFPKPLFATQISGSMYPVPDYVFYQDQAEELNRVTGRIEKLIEALKVRGVYDQSFEELGGIMKAGDNQLIPVKDFAARFDGKDLRSVIAFAPLDELAKVVAGLYVQRDQIKQTIYEITGISDIIRGSTDPNETLGAQQMKGQFADMRLSRRRNAVNAFLRDIVRIKTEIVAEHFEPMTLQLMTGIEVTPEMTQIMRSDVLRSYKIDIETDSTIAADANAEQKNRLEALTSLSQFLQMAVPAVQQGFLQPELAKELALFGIRGFKHSRQLEDVIERMGSQDQNDPAAMQAQIGQAQQQIQQLQQQLQQGGQMLQEAQKKAEGREMDAQVKMQTSQQQIMADREKNDAGIEFEREKLAATTQLELQKAAMQIEADDRRHLMTLQAQRDKNASDESFRMKELARQNPDDLALQADAESDGGIRESLAVIAAAAAAYIEKQGQPFIIRYGKDGRIAQIGDKPIVRQ